MMYKILNKINNLMLVVALKAKLRIKLKVIKWEI